MELSHSITVLDTYFVKPEFAASYLIREGKELAFVDTGTTYSVPGFMKYLKQSGFEPGDVKYIILSHIHLDHAGGASALMKACPHAELVVHPRGKRHMIDPSILIAGTYAVFGEANAKRLYGDITGIPKDRVIAAEDGMSLSLNGRPLYVFDAPGHAKHHLAVWDEKSSGIFTGDAFGLSYGAFQTEKGSFTYPTTTPVHFDPADMHSTIDRCMSFDPHWIYVTHYGPVSDVAKQAERMHFLIDEFTKIMHTLGSEQDHRHQKISQALGNLLYQELTAHGCTLSYKSCLPWLEKDIELNAQGLAYWWDHVFTKKC
jgi:glyoxylase-like metal-dependent hydrolase (beta-lactamase superfamily II)